MHSSFFIVTNFELWVCIEIMWIKWHIVPFLYIATNLKCGYTREYFYVYLYLIICNYKKGTMWIKICIAPFFYNYKLSSIGIQGNENSFFTQCFRVVPDRFFEI